jgi:glycerol-3-phosphate dehydrogenase
MSNKYGYPEINWAQIGYKYLGVNPGYSPDADDTYNIGRCQRLCVNNKEKVYWEEDSSD